MSTAIPNSTLEKFTTFGDLLRYLRRASGLTQLELSIQVGYSHAQISRLEQNLRLPDIPTIEARFVPALGLENEPKVVARLLELAANVRREDAPGLGMCPYKGLSYFDESDADLFVGREALTAKLAERILSLTLSQSSHERRFLAVVGASGSGKSSLGRAGLVPALRWEKRSADWHIQILTPTVHPLESLASSLTQESNTIRATTDLMDDLMHDPRSLQIYAKRKLQSENQTHLLLVIDQFEELFTLCRSEEERDSFIGNLLAAASDANGPVSVIITLRADFYAHCANYIELREALARNQEYIGAMSDEELRRAIEEPARRGRWEFEPGLVDLLLHDIGHEPGALPLLSHALFETWQRRRGRTMTLSGYASSGGVRSAIAETAETVFTDQFTREERAVARRIFLRLTELNDENSTADTRRRAKFNELILKPEDAPVTHAVLKTLADARLIITSQDSAEVAHEALIREWPTLRGWLEENRESLRLHRQLTEAAQEWNALGRSADMLYRGARLGQVREWASTHRDEMNELEYDFLNASVELSEHEARALEEQRQRELETTRKLVESERQRAEEQTQSARRLRRRAIYLTGAFGAALIMAFAAFFFGRQSQIASRLASSRELAAASITNLDVDPERSILLAMEALQIGYTVEAEDALHRAIQTSRIQRVVQAHDPGATMLVNLSPDGKQFITATEDGSVKVWETGTGEQILRLDGLYATYSPDGQRLAVVAPERIVRIIEVRTGKEMPLSNQIDAGLTLVFSPECVGPPQAAAANPLQGTERCGSRLATVASNNTPKIWDARTGKELVAFPGHTDFVGSLAFSPDGTRLLTGSDDGTARVWDASKGEQLLKLANHPGWVFAARFSPNGKLIVTVSGNQAYLWDAESGKRLLTLTSHQNDIFAVAFSPDGKRLATGGVDRKIKIWDVTTGKELLTLSGHTGAIDDLSFSLDGRQLISSSNDGTVRIWNVAPSRELLTLGMDHANGQLAFSADGSQLATVDGAGVLSLWAVHSGHELIALPRAGDKVKDLIMSSDGKYAITAGEDGKIRIWDLYKELERGTLLGHTGKINAIAFSQDGNYVATASDDYKAKLWKYSSDKISNAPVFTWEASRIVFSVAFNVDGTRLATGNQEGTVNLWDTKTGKELQVLRGHSDYITAIAFSPDGKHMATASSDGTAKVWNVSTSEEEFTLHGHTGAVTSIAYNPECDSPPGAIAERCGTRIATASNDGTAKLWDAATGEEILTFFGDGSALNDILFSPDGKLLATGGTSGVRVYVLQIDDLIALARNRITRSLTSEECRKYLHRSAAACAPAVSIATTTPMPPTENGRICQVTNTGGLYDHSFNETIFKGVQDSTAQFGWDTKVLQSASTPDFEKNINEFLRGDCDLIIGLPPMMDAIRAAAEANPSQKFMFTDFPYAPPVDNVRSQVYAVDQAAFLAGYVAASVTQTDKVGVFGGIDIPSVTDFMNGFVLGVQHYNDKNGTNIEVLGWDVQKREGFFVGGFCCAAEGRLITGQLLEAGADIIFPVAGTDVGAGALFAVKSHGDAYIIGVDNDWTVSESTYADIILTSVMKNLDVSVVQTVKAIEEGTFTGGVHVGTLESGDVGLAPFHELDSLVSPEVKAELEQIKKEIIAGNIKTRP